MDGILHIAPTEFYDPISQIKTYGVRVFDDIVSYYDNTWQQFSLDTNEILKYVGNIDDYRISELLDECYDNKLPIIVGRDIVSYDIYVKIF